MQLEPVAFYHGDAQWRLSAPRQGVYTQASGVIDFLPHKAYDQALRDLEGFDRLWVIFHFHLNPRWRPTVRPPIPPLGQDRVGVFSSRSPYRPNPIGLSCVRLLGVEGLRVHIAESDLLDGTPILDIKPYIAAADSFPAARAGWLDRAPTEAWTLAFACEEALDFILAHGGPDLRALARVQLSHNPLDSSRKRVALNPDGSATLALRTWRLRFHHDADTRSIVVEQVLSGYSPVDLAPGAPDRYEDKPLHREFCALFPPIS